MTVAGSPLTPERLAVHRELVRHAVMAASSHNTQPWRFAPGERSLTLWPDWSRRTPVVDPDDHHLFVSLGCAAENLVHAALANGLHADVAVGADRVDTTLDRTRPSRTPLFEAMPRRQCSRCLYDGRPLSPAELDALLHAGGTGGVGVILITDRSRMDGVLDYVARGIDAQVGDPAFVGELRDWIRFNRADALRTGDGLFSGCTGNPSVPRWIGRRLFGRLLRARSEKDTAARQLRSSAGVAVFAADHDDRVRWVEVGRAYQRFALQATALGIRNAFLNQPVEVPALRPQFAAWLGIAGRRPDLVVRFGRGPEMPRSLRRPVDDVLI